MEGTVLFPGTRFPEDAFYVAKRLILTLYKIQDERLPVRATLLSTRILRDTCKGKPKSIKYRHIENIYTPCKEKPKRNI
jgi:hypothetical protein